MSNSRFIKFICSETADWLQEKYPNAFLLLCLIARRARRTADHPDGLLIGDAMIGDHQSAGLTRQEYRTAVDRLVDLNMIEIIWNGKKFLKREKSTIKVTIVGMLVNLKDSSVWDINSEECNQRVNQRATNDQPRTRMNKNEKEEKEEKYKKEERQTLREAHGKFVKLSQDEYETLCKAHTKPIIDDYITRINDYCEASKPNGYASYAAVIRTWMRNAENKQKPSQTTTQSFSTHQNSFFEDMQKQREKSGFYSKFKGETI